MYVYCQKNYMAHYGCGGGKLVSTGISRQGIVAGARKLALFAQFVEFSCVQLVEPNLVAVVE